MLRIIAVMLAGYTLFGTSAPVQSQPPVRDLYADTWVATDALGRSMPDATEAGPVKTDQRRVVGIFYIAWHVAHLAGMPSPYGADVTRVLAASPEARLDGDHPAWQRDKYGSYHWGEPELGYFLSQDPYVAAKDMSMLADAGVDVLLMDVTNSVRYWDEWEIIFTAMTEMAAAGNKVPQFTFWAFNGSVITVVQDLYERIYKADRFRDLWFEWDGKPLLLYNGNPKFDANGNGPPNPNPNYDPAAKDDPNHPHYGDPDYCEELYQDYTREVKDFFTLRTMWWGYHEWAGKRFVGTEGNWSFGYDLSNPAVHAMDPKDLIAPWNGQPEQAAVTPAQHPMSLVGKSWSRHGGQPALNEYDLPVPTLVPWLGEEVTNPEGYGIYFQERWEEALPYNPEFIYINDWNEWTAGKYHPDPNHPVPFMNRVSNYFFVDQYNSEFNRCVQPMKDGYTDNYYMQMAQNIRRYKGARPIPRNQGLTAVVVDGQFSDWAAVPVEYRDTIGDVWHRDHPGYGGTHYTNTSGRNDLVTCKVACTTETVAFYAACQSDLTPSTDPNWMLLLVDADQNHDTGWYGYDLLINQEVTSPTETSVHQYMSNDTGEGDWQPVGVIPYRVTGNELELALPRELGGWTDSSGITFDFHWCDNPVELVDPISLCTHGDSAPNRRFNYRYIWEP